MATNRPITGIVWNTERTNDDGTQILVGTVTYSDASTKAVEVPVMRTVP